MCRFTLAQQRTMRTQLNGDLNDLLVYLIEMYLFCSAPHSDSWYGCALSASEWTKHANNYRNINPQMRIQWWPYPCVRLSCHFVLWYDTVRFEYFSLLFVECHSGGWAAAFIAIPIEYQYCMIQKIALFIHIVRDQPRAKPSIKLTHSMHASPASTLRPFL